MPIHVVQSSGLCPSFHHLNSSALMQNTITFTIPVYLDMFNDLSDIYYIII